jgi:hypothetical protein
LLQADQIVQNEVGGTCGTLGEERKVYKVLRTTSDGKKPLGTPRHRWEDGIRMDLRRWAGGVQRTISWLRTGTGDEFF